ncbi:permease, partial [Candidatus Parcubacteria bacterium]|nr:permease [Candidatus Parcubacteria bacterium]
IAIVLSQIISIYLPQEKTEMVFKANKKNLVKASVVGIATPGPLLAFLPLLKTFKKKGVSVSIIVAFITGQTLIGPMRFFLEVNYFGITFFVYRVLIAFLIAMSVAVCFRFLEKYIKF